ncbi:hypothetical protein RIF29_45503 [Crotalaria pallida]|uniref:Uncharacterized protein n=1 Tax=Crotalaria pallida TaxID=3830 RepID=A0AAN9HL92_CROPI
MSTSGGFVLLFTPVHEGILRSPKVKWKRLIEIRRGIRRYIDWLHSTFVLAVKLCFLQLLDRIQKLAEERFSPVLGHKLDQGEVFIRMIDIPP